jgi:hypothetical protein
MADTEVRGREWLLLIDADDNGSYLPVACLTSVSISSELDEIDANSKCGNKTLPGDVFSQEISFEGIAIDQTGTPTKDSYNSLYTLHKNKTKFPFKLGKASPVTGDIIYSSTGGYILSWELTSDDNDVNKFSGSIKPEVPTLTQTVTV